MRFNDQIDFVMQHIKKNKLRVFMTVLAATMGCAFLIVLASVGFGMQKTIEDDILSNENVTSITMYNSEGVTAEKLEAIEKMDNVNAVLPVVGVNAIVRSYFEDRKGEGSLKLTNFEKYEAVKEGLAEGRFPQAPHEVVVGYHFAQSLLNDADREAIVSKQAEAEKNGTWYSGEEEGYKGSIIGKEIDMTVAPYENNAAESERVKLTIVGVLPEPTYEWQTDNSIFMADSESTFIQGLFDDVVAVSKTEVTEEEPLLNPTYTIYATQLTHVASILEQLRADGYSVYSVTEELDEIELVFAIVKIGLVFVGTIAVLIASIGIFNTMTMAVTERTREIGVMKAIGASPKLIHRLFLMESAFIGLLGTVLAVAISYGLSFAANALLPIIMESMINSSDVELTFSYIPWELVLAAAVISIGVALISGVRPARKATKIEVMQALRQEM